MNTDMQWQDRISVDPNVLVGKPVIKGTRLAVDALRNQGHDVLWARADMPGSPDDRV